MRKEAQCEGPDRMNMIWPEATSWTIRGVGTVVTLEAGGALLVAGAAGVALAQPVPVSREMAERIGTAERAERAKLIEAAHGGPVALPTPSPFLNEQYVRTLPTQDNSTRIRSSSLTPCRVLRQAYRATTRFSKSAASSTHTSTRMRWPPA